MSVGLPALLMSVIVTCFWWPKAFAGGWWGRGMVVIVLIGAVAVSFIASVGLPAWPPPQKWHGLVWFATALAFLGLVDTAVHHGQWAARMFLAGFVGLAASWLLKLPDMSQLTVGCVIGLGAFLTGMADARGGRGLTMLGWGWASAAAISMLTLVTGAISVSLMAGALSATAACVLVLAIIFRSRSVGEIGGGGLVMGGLLTALALTSYSYDYDTVPTWAWGLSLGSIVTVCLFEVGAFARWQGLSASIVRFVFAAALPVCAILLNWNLIEGALSG